MSALMVCLVWFGCFEDIEHSFKYLSPTPGGPGAEAAPQPRPVGSRLRSCFVFLILSPGLLITSREGKGDRDLGVRVALHPPSGGRTHNLGICLTGMGLRGAGLRARSTTAGQPRGGARGPGRRSCQPGDADGGRGPKPAGSPARRTEAERKSWVNSAGVSEA